MDNVTLICGNCLEVMKSFSNNSVDSIVTDPPYEIGFMGKKWDKSGISYNVDMWKEALRILKPGAFLLAFGGSRTYHRIACAIEDAGFEIRDQIQWVYGSGFPKSHKEDDGFGTALKPAHEPIVMARKPLSEKNVAENIKKWGTGAINIDACRIPGEPTPINKLAKWSGFGQVQKPDYSQTINNDGRWPSNFIHDGSDEVVEMFPVVTSGKPVGKRHAKNKIFGQYAPGQELTVYGDSGSAARFYYCAKANRSDRDDGIYGTENKPLIWSSGTKSPGTFQSPNTDKSAKNNHPTVKPTELMRYLCRLVTPIGGTVLDMFLGSGSTGRGAVIEGFKFIGIDDVPEYLPIAAMRIKAVQRQMLLPFSENYKRTQP